jgi:hypothetical protein
VAVTRRFPGDATHSGFVRELDGELVVVEKFHDFYSEGFSLLRIDDIDAVRNRPGDELFARIIEGDGLSRKDRLENICRGDDLGGALARIQARYGLVALHCETGDPNEDEYILGELSGVTDDDALIWVLGPDATWEPELDSIALDDITQVEFATPYAEILARYAPPSPSGRSYK